MIETLKQQISLSKFAQHCYPQSTFSPDGYQACPFCGRPRKLNLSQDRYYRCFHPACDKRGSVIDFCINAGKAGTVPQAITYLRQFTEVRLEEPRPAAITAPLSRIWTILRDQLKRSADALAFCQARCLPPDELGYYPSSDFLQQCGFSTKQLEDLGLLSKSGRELLAGRLIFPFTSDYGDLVHIQGRSLDPESDLRWLSSQGKPSIDHYVLNAAAFRQAQDKALFICEGGSDTYSLVGLGLPAIGIAGVQVNLRRHLKVLAGIPVLVICLDNDRYALGSRLSGQYKSWNAMMSELVQLRLCLPDAIILCMPPPSQPGLLDVNDWVMQGMTRNELVRIARQSPTLEDFVLKHLAEHPSFMREAVYLSTLESNEQFRVDLRSYLSGVDPLEIAQSLL